MKIQRKQVLTAILTLGFSGYFSARKIIEENELKTKIIFSEQIVGLMLGLAIISAFFVGGSVIVGVYFIHELPEQLKAWFDVDNTYPKAPALLDAILWIPQAYVFFILLHAYLGVAFFQHAEGIKKEDRWRVLLFGFHALEWNPKLYLQQTETDQDAVGNG